MINKSLKFVESKELKKNDTKNNPDFNFLMSSMDREKENLNTINNKSIDYTKCKNTKPFFNNDVSTIKMQRQSNASCTQQINFNLTELMEKVLKFISLNQKIIQCDRKSSQGFITQARLLGDQIQHNIQSFKFNKQAVVFSNIELRRSLPFKTIEIRKEQHQLRQKVKFLQQQNLKITEENNRLDQLVSKHEKANIKMHIKINETECKGIQDYKIQLQESYKAYKQLSLKLAEYENRLKGLEKIEKLYNLQQKQLDKQKEKIETLEIYLQKNNKKQNINKDNNCNQLNQLKKIIEKQNFQLEGLNIKMKLLKQKQKDAETQEKIIQTYHRKQIKKNQNDQQQYLSFMMMQAREIEKLLREKNY